MVAAGFIVRLNLNKYSVFRAFISTGKSVILDSPNTLDAESITEEKVSAQSSIERASTTGKAGG